MTWWTPDTMRAACGGTWLVRPPQIELPPDRPADIPLPSLHAPITGVSTDTRSIKPGQAFVALRGENFDGHRFIADAARGGASIIIIDDARSLPEGGFTPPVGVMKVADTGAALLKLAASYRKSLARTKVVAVCGSNGKTTTTRLIDHVLGQFFRGTASAKSFNNAVGVPLTILSAKENDQYLVCEVGTNAPGEIAQLGEVVQPDIAVITSIGREHLEKLGDLAGVAREEAAILKFVRPKGCVVVTGDAPELREHLAKPLGVVVTFGRDKSANLRLTSVRHEAREGGVLGLVFTINGRQEVRLPLVGEHNALNAIAALAVARRMGIDDAKAAGALAHAGGAEMRLARVEVAGVQVLNDAYNANPDSMLAAIETAVALRASVMRGASRLVLVLGEMLELGAASESSHRSVARAAAQHLGKGVDAIVLVGTGMKAGLDELRSTGAATDTVHWLPDADETSQQRVLELLRPGDLVLLKGSRRVRLERMLEALTRAGTVGSGGVSRGASSAGGGDSRASAAGFLSSAAPELKPALGGAAVSTA